MPGRFTNLEFDDERFDDDLSIEASKRLTIDDNHYLQQGDEAYRWGRFEEALKLYTRCLAQNRAVIRAWVGQVQMLVQLGEHNEARLWSDKALELFRDNGELLAAKSQACTRLADLKGGMSFSDASLRSPGSSAWRWIVRGEALLARREKHVDRCFDKAGGEAGFGWFDRVVIARIYLYYRRASNALHHLQLALNEQPTHGYIWFEMGNCQAALGLNDVARTSYARCLELRADYREARLACDALPSVSLFKRIRGMFRR